MPSLQKLQKIVTKLKNQIISASNYLELETTINTFNEIKQKHFDSSDEMEIKKKKSSKQDFSQNDEKKKLIQTTEELIRQKIKYFKKIALKKINSIKNETDLSPKFSPLEKPTKKESKNHKQFSNSSSILTVPDKRSSKESPFFRSKQLKELKALEEKTILLEKTLNNSSEKQKRSPSRSQKKLKQSRSAENFFGDKFKDSFTFRDEQNQSKKMKKQGLNQSQGFCHSQGENNELNEFEDDNKTQIKMFNKKGKKYEQNYEQEDVEYFKGKVQFLQKMIGSMQFGQGLSGQALKNENNQIFEQFHFKLRQKSLELEQVRGRLKYYQTSSQQLRNRVMNEQRRYEDYITSLKEHIKRQQSQIYDHEKEKKIMNELIKEYEFKVEVEEKEKLKHLEQIQAMLKEKEKAKLNEKAKNDDLRKELEIMAKQQINIRELEVLLKQQKIQSSVILQKNTLFKREVQSLKQQLKTTSQDKQILEELLEIKLQEIEQYKLEVFQLKRQATDMQAEMEDMKEQIENMQKSQDQEEKRKDKLIKKKVEKLKEVKSLLADNLT